MVQTLQNKITVHSEPPSQRGSSVLIGFPGSGLVGSIALAYLVEQLKFKQIGVITSRMFPPLAMMSNGLINIPVRIYERENIIAIMADIPIQPNICYDVAETIIDWLRPFEIKEVVTIAGIITNETEKRVFCVGTNTEILEKVKDLGFILQVGSISGIASSIMTECKLHGMNAVGLLGETINAPDPRAAASMIKLLNGMYDFGLKIEPLIEQAEEIESSMHKLAEEVQSAEENAPKREQLPMYG